MTPKYDQKPQITRNEPPITEQTRLNPPPSPLHKDEPPTQSTTNSTTTTTTCCCCCCEAGQISTSLQDFYNANSFLIKIIISILLAYTYPPLGETYLHPQITASWMAVVFIFTMAGLSMKTEAMAEAMRRVGFNIFVQLFNFGVVSLTVYGFTEFVIGVDGGGVLTRELSDGMRISASLPITVTTSVIMTRVAGGDEAASIFNSAFGNLMGVFVSPVLILLYTGEEGSVDFGAIFYKLGLRVLLPVTVGQILHNFSSRAMEFIKIHKQNFTRWQEYAMIYIVYTVFCKTFGNKSSSSSPIRLHDVLWMAIFQLFLLLLVMTLAWCSLGLFFHEEPKLKITGLFGCTQKSLSMGIPLINTIYQQDPNAGLYTLPLLVWHPLQIIIGSAIAPRLAEDVADGEEEERMDVSWQDRSVKEIRSIQTSVQSSMASFSKSSLVAWESAPDIQECLDDTVLDL